jgi:hypothetical protein
MCVWRVAISISRWCARASICASVSVLMFSLYVHVSISVAVRVDDQTWAALIATWDSFVEGVRLLMSYSVTINNVNRAHAKFREYCIGVEAAWGTTFMKPNHHHLMHVKQCVLDYGPPHVFWVFAFERVNGHLANYHSSMRTVELEMMKRWVQQQQTMNQDPSSLPTIALEQAARLPELVALSRADHESMQLYPPDQPLPSILNSRFNKSWYTYQGLRERYPYPDMHQPDELDPEQQHVHPRQAKRHTCTVDEVKQQEPRAQPEPQQQQQRSRRMRSLAAMAARKLLYADCANPMSNEVTKPCTMCAQLVENISLLRSEDKQEAVAFMPSTPRMWREFRQ